MIRQGPYKCHGNHLFTLLPFGPLTKKSLSLLAKVFSCGGILYSGGGFILENIYTGEHYQ